MHAGMSEAGHDGSAPSFRSRFLGSTDEAKSEDGCNGEGEERAEPLYRQSDCPGCSGERRADATAAMRPRHRIHRFCDSHIFPRARNAISSFFCGLLTAAAFDNSAPWLVSDARGQKITHDIDTAGKELPSWRRRQATSGFPQGFSGSRMGQ